MADKKVKPNVYGLQSRMRMVELLALLADDHRGLIDAAGYPIDVYKPVETWDPEDQKLFWYWRSHEGLMSLVLRLESEASLRTIVEQNQEILRVLGGKDIG